MTREYTVSIPARESRKFLAYVKGLGGVIAPKRKKSSYEKALEDVMMGRVSKTFSSVDDLFADLTA